MTLSDLLDRPALVFALLAAASAAILAAAFAFQYIGGLEPCVLCIYQRYPYGAVIGLGLLGVLAANRPGAGRGLLAALMGLAAAALVTDAAIAGFHVGVEQKWWEGTQACVGVTGAGTIEELRAQLLGQKVVRCDEVAWSLAGISMAGYNMLIALGLGALAAAATLRLVRTDRPEGGRHG